MIKVLCLMRMDEELVKKLPAYAEVLRRWYKEIGVNSEKCSTN
jgi:hypothetical protein